MTWSRRVVPGIALVTLCIVMTSSSWSQETPPDAPKSQPPVTEPIPILPTTRPPVAAYPLELLQLMVRGRGPVTLTPSISISEEFNDNVFSDNQDRQWDFITNISPAVTLTVNLPTLELSAGYSTTSEIYARETQLSNALGRHNFLLYGAYQATPLLTLTVGDWFELDRNASVVGGFSTGRQESWSNTFAPGVTWQLTPRDYLILSAYYSVLRFEGSGAGLDSDTYSFQASFRRALTPRLTGILSYEFTYLDSRGEEDSSTHTPTVGFAYQLTPTLTATVEGGASITQIAGETHVSPTGSASLEQLFRFGSAAIRYSHDISVAGGFGGTNETYTVTGLLTLTTLLRGLVVVFSPEYSSAKSVSSQQENQVNVNSFNLTLGFSYQLFRYASLFGGYTFFRQRTGRSSSTEGDVDQNRVRLGVQIGYPFTFFD